MSILQSPIIKISLRHLFAKKRQTIVAMLGVMFGIAVFIFQAGLMSGFQMTFIEQTVNTTANIRLYNEANKNRPSILSKVDSLKGRLLFVRNQKPKDEQPRIRNGKPASRALITGSRYASLIFSQVATSSHWVTQSTALM